MKRYYSDSYNFSTLLSKWKRFPMLTPQKRYLKVAEKPSFKYKDWSSVVGLEVHAQIQTISKLFSGAGTKFAAPINSQVSLFDCAIPGTLPVLNGQSVRAAVLTALALNCKINPVSEFDRKHYFYADMPSGYQITQQRLPLAIDGYLEFVMSSSTANKTTQKKKSVIKQIQLEQDSGKSLHDEFDSGSLIDLNRAGVGLMEIVFEPDLSNGEEAAALIGELAKILTTLKTCNCKMEEGSLRVDANVSVNRLGQSLGTRTEIKNLNSTRAVARAIDYEIARQIDILESGGVIFNETRGFDSQLKETVSMRDKEAKQDYRFMPEPNLLPLHLSHLKIDLEDLLSRMPTLPEAERCFLMNRYQMNLETAVQLVNETDHLNFFKNVMDSRPHLNVTMVCNLFLTDLVGILNKNKTTIDQCSINPLQFSELVEMLQTNYISHNASKDILALLVGGDPRKPRQIAVDEKWALDHDQTKLEDICLAIIKRNEKSVEAYRSGKKKALNSLIGELKKATQNQFEMADAVRTLKRLVDK